MQLNSVYLYPNKIDVFTNALASWQTERYRRVYNRNLKIYRSVDNRIDLQVRNSDQKAADITGSTLVFNIITREGKDLVLSKDCTTSSASSGKVYVTLTKEELLNLESGFYNYSVIQEIRETINSTEYRVTSKTPMFQDAQYGAIGTVEVSGDVLGETEESLEITKFQYINPATTGYTDPKYYTTSIIDAIGNTQTPNSLHTFQIYFSNNYSGTVKIQGSLSEGGTPNVWTDVIPEFSVVDQSTPVYRNVTGKYNFFRIRHFPNVASAVAEFTVQQTIFFTYIVGIKTPGIGYHVGDVITIKGDRLGGETPTQDLSITVTGIGTLGAITSISWIGNSYNGVKTFVVSGEIPTTGTVDKVLYR
jgi:hypothetical protein